MSASVLGRVKDQSPRWLKDAADLTTRAYGMATTPLRPVPDFLVIGTKRGGTTSLFNYLLQHPAVLGLYPQVRGKKSTDYFFKEVGRGDRWYRSHFHTTTYRGRLERRLGHRPVGGEASPYYGWDPRVAGRVHALAPQVKAVMLLRDPTERAWSHYRERVHNGVEPLSFADALAAEEARTGGELERMLEDPRYYSKAHDWYSYRARGIYLPQLLGWRSLFPAAQVLVLRSEDLYADVQGIFDEVCGFLGVPGYRLPTTTAFNGIGSGRRMPDDVRRELDRFYAPHNAELARHLGRSLW